METKRFRLHLLISQTRLREKPLETQRLELYLGSTANVLGSPSSWYPVFTTADKVVSRPEI